MAIKFCPRCARIMDDVGPEACPDCKYMMRRIEGITLRDFGYGYHLQDRLNDERKIFEEYIEPLGEIDETLHAFQFNYEEMYGINGPATKAHNQRIASINVQGDMEAAMANRPQCPTCGTTDIEKIGAIERGASIAILGPFSNKINKTFKCRKCGYTW